MRAKQPASEFRSGRLVPSSSARRFDHSLSIAEISRRIAILKQSLGRAVEHSEISIPALAAPN
jgi:hypothetical protein